MPGAGLFSSGFLHAGTRVRIAGGKAAVISAARLLFARALLGLRLMPELFVTVFGAACLLPKLVGSLPDSLIAIVTAGHGRLRSMLYSVVVLKLLCIRGGDFRNFRTKNHTRIKCLLVSRFGSS